MKTATNKEKGEDIAIQVTDAYSEMNRRAEHNAHCDKCHKKIMQAAVTMAKLILDQQLSGQFNKAKS